MDKFSVRVDPRLDWGIGVGPTQSRWGDEGDGTLTGIVGRIDSHVTYGSDSTRDPRSRPRVGEDVRTCVVPTTDPGPDVAVHPLPDSQCRWGFPPTWGAVGVSVSVAGRKEVGGRDE